MGSKESDCEPLKMRFEGVKKLKATQTFEVSHPLNSTSPVLLAAYNQELIRSKLKLSMEQYITI